MKFQAVRGTRDFYPDEMAVLNWIRDGWRRVSLRHGFVEYDGPILEHLELYTAKSGQEIVEQLFHLTDRAGRALAIRPEITPTLARMVGARAQSLGRPIKWFSVPRLCRAERPQRGRLREFFQWNIDVIGVDDPIADAECIFVAVDYLRQAGLSADQIVVRISDRRLVGGLLAGAGLDASQHEAAFALLDKADRIESARLQAMWDEQFGRVMPFAALAKLLQVRSLSEFAAAAQDAGVQPEAFEPAQEALHALWGHLERFQITDYCEFDLRVVRGLAYYTAVVFEIHDRAGRFRAIAGGGRYDDLLQTLGGPAIPAVGFGMGDVVLSELLRDLGKLQRVPQEIDVFVADAEPELFAEVLAITATLRKSGLAAEFAYKRQGLSKQLRTASQRRARFCLIVGREYRQDRKVVLKEMASGQQREVDLASLLAEPHTYLAART